MLLLKPSVSVQDKDVESSFIANGTSAHAATNPSEPNIHVVSLFKREDSYLVSPIHFAGSTAGTTSRSPFRIEPHLHDPSST